MRRHTRRPDRQTADFCDARIRWVGTPSGGTSKEAPSTGRWYRNALIARTVADTLEAMKPELPRLAFDPAGVKIPD